MCCHFIPAGWCRRATTSASTSGAFLEQHILRSSTICRSRPHVPPPPMLSRRCMMLIMMLMPCLKRMPAATHRYKESDLNVGENSCVDRCSSKYWQVRRTAGPERRSVCWAPHVGARSLIFESAGRLNKHTRLPWCDAGDGHCGPDAWGAGRFQLADAHPRGPLLNGELRASAASGPAVGLPPHTSTAPVDAHPSRLVLCLDVGAMQLWPRRGCMHRPQLTATIDRLWPA